VIEMNVDLKKLSFVKGLSIEAWSATAAAKCSGSVEQRSKRSHQSSFSSNTQ
jgi:hypothetical protein